MPGKDRFSSVPEGPSHSVQPTLPAFPVVVPADSPTFEVVHGHDLLNSVVCFVCLLTSATPGLPAVAFVTSIFEASSLSFSVLGLAIETGLTLP